MTSIFIALLVSLVASGSIILLSRTRALAWDDHDVQGVRNFTLGHYSPLSAGECRGEGWWNSGRHAIEREAAEFCARGGVLQRDRQHLALRVEIQQGVLV